MVAAIAGIAAAVINALLVLGVRRGLPNDIAAIAQALVYTFLFIAYAVAIEAIVTNPIHRVLLHIAVVIGLLALPIVALGSAIWIVAGIGGAAAALYRARPTFDGRVVLVLGIGSWLVIASGLYGLAGFQHREIQTHFLLPEYGKIGLLHRDPLTFVTYAAEIMNGNWPGPALDGIQAVVYHFGIHMLMAALSSASRSSPFDTYMVVQQLTFVPLVIFYAALATWMIARAIVLPARAGALAVFLVTALVLVVPSHRWLVVFYNESSSATAALPFLMLAAAAIMLAPNREPHISLLNTCALVAVPLACAPLKLSNFVTIGGIAGYLILRQRCSMAVTWAILGMGLALMVIGAKLLWPDIAGRPFVIELWEHDSYYEAQWALLILLASVVLYGMCRVLKQSCASGALEVLLFSVPVAVVFTWVITNVYEVYTARYFFNNIGLLSLPIIAVSLAALLHVGRLGQGMPALVGAVVLVVAAVPIAMEYGKAPLTGTATSIGAAIERMCRVAVPEDRCRANNPRAFTRHRPEFTATLDSAVGNQIIAVLKAAPAADAFFVPSGNDDYWRFASGGNRPFEALNFLPAQFGRPLLLGLPPTAYKPDLTKVKYGIAGHYDESARTRDLSDPELCAHARVKSVGRVLIFESLNPPRTRVLSCT